MEFARLHLRFAHAFAAVSGCRVLDALGSATPAARLAGPAWEDFRGVPTPAELALAYRAGAPRGSRAGLSFSTVAREDGSVRLHFQHPGGGGALAPENLRARRAELLGALTGAQRTSPADALLHGGSWLYHLEGYRRIFPEFYLDTATTADSSEELTYLALWGQFLSSSPALHAPTTELFLRRLAGARTAEQAVAAFPLTKLEVAVPLADVIHWLRRTVR